MMEQHLIRRIGFLMEHPSPHMVGFLDALAKRSDCAVRVVYFRSGSPERRWGDPVSCLPHTFASKQRVGAGLLSVGAVLRVVEQVRADVWIVNTCYTAAETWACVAWLNAANLPWVYMNEPLRPRRGVGTIKNALMRLMLKRAAGVIGTGGEAVARYAKLAGTAKP